MAAVSQVLVRQRRASLPGVFVFWHLLSLDAPTVAVLWAWAFARAAHVHASASALAVLGVGTWLIYVADRLLDSRAGAPREALRQRHRFHAEHRRAFLIASAVAGMALVWLIATRLSAAARREDAAIFAVFLVYFVFVHLIGSRFPRSLAVGIVFAAASAVPAWSEVSGVAVTWILSVALFAAVCWLNCAAIHAWEQPGWPARQYHIPAMAVGVALGASALAAASGTALRDPPGLRLAGSMLASVLLLLALHLDHGRMRRDDDGTESAPLRLRVLADAALLTPVLFFVPWRP
jgi:hypothetical protein